MVASTVALRNASSVAGKILSHRSNISRDKLCSVLGLFNTDDLSLGSMILDYDASTQNVFSTIVKVVVHTQKSLTYLEPVTTFVWMKTDDGYHRPRTAETSDLPAQYLGNPISSISEIPGHVSRLQGLPAPHSIFPEQSLQTARDVGNGLKQASRQLEAMLLSSGILHRFHLIWNAPPWLMMRSCFRLETSELGMSNEEILPLSITDFDEVYHTIVKTFVFSKTKDLRWRKWQFKRCCWMIEGERRGNN